MISLVRVALSRPYTFVVMALMIVIGGGLAALRTPADIFPNIPVPVIAVGWSFNGLTPEDMAGRILTPYQRSLTTTVNDIEHIEGTSYPGLGIVKIFFQPGADVRLANAQVTAVSQTLLRQLPPGTTPPLILNYNASTVPILQLALSGQGLTEQQLYDLGTNFLRPQLVTVPGAAMPGPAGGRTRQIQIDLDPQALQSKGLSAQDVGNAIAAQTQITPAGFVKIGEFQYNLLLNNAPGSVAELAALPIRTVNGATLTIGDVANVRDGAQPQQNVVHVDGQRSVLLTVLKNGAVSTISIVNGVLAMLPQLLPSLPPQLRIAPLNDQSVFVKAAITGVAFEGALAAALTSLMILLFLGSWRSTLIIATSIPLAILAAIFALAAFGQTLNVMTLGGLALAVGILVDDATVTIENINWHLEHGKDVRTAILDGAQQIVVPAFVSLLCICIVFVPMFFLPGVSGFLFVPMAMSVTFAMVASFILSRTLVPTMAAYLLQPHAGLHGHGQRRPTHFLGRLQRGFETQFERFRMGYGRVLRLAIRLRWTTLALFLVFAFGSLALVPFLGRNFFPEVDSGTIALHARAPAGTRLEETSALFDEIQREIRRLIPPGEIDTIVDTIGLPNSTINVTYSASGTVGPMDGDIIISLKREHRPTAEHIRRLRMELPRLFPTVTFSFLPADITSQILNFGAPAPIEVQVTGPRIDENQEHAQRILRAIRGIDGLVDARIQQPAGSPTLRFMADRTRINALGLDERDVTTSLAGAIAGSLQTAPVYWLNPANGVTYPVVAQTPEYLADTVEELESLPVTGPRATEPQVLGALGTLVRANSPSVVSQYNIQPMVSVFAATQGRDLGAVADAVRREIAKLDAEKPAAVRVTLRGQYQTMNTAFTGMGFGLLGAVVMIYLLIVINFQSWADPFVIIAALPSALAGIAWMLFLSGTPLSVPALTGAIMCMGVATANSILVVSFAREKLAELGNARMAAFEAGVTRFRPVLMTALAMVIGMLPMALGLGEGGEQNAPLGRAVIGGLIVATCASLVFVPTVFAMIHGRRRHAVSDIRPGGATAHA
ncbi:efflux RND transporter permease subunit [Siccirubricoccus sp. KC 17139]|uniref:Efflux RND transporter permease subunit n=1 Tax=Siccirubricoccus soli TaxID=2899147 RepID=A0ABT1D6B5_9PROT|nr:efflux RND transporter permease subunit [Siccirubricoccus soli]MCO6417470.1 efflux RND transporter permease subunit [Siccirubricoccus soli]MCP2683605.1 efflux RND transporter permease subunit [Siccirubricoccus soli]